MPWLICRRLVISSGLILSLTAAQPPAGVSLPDAVEAGRVAATLSDWQTMAFFLVVLLAIATVERMISGVQNAYARKAERDITAASLERLASALELRSNDITINLALIQEALARAERQR